MIKCLEITYIREEWEVLELEEVNNFYFIVEKHFHITDGVWSRIKNKKGV